MQYRINGKFASKEAWEAFEKANRDNVTLPQLVEAIQETRPNDVKAMVANIGAALKERVSFELLNKPNGSHIDLRKVVNAFEYNPRVAAFFIAVDANPDLLFNRTRKDGTRANLKGLLKVRKLIDYITGRTTVIEIVTKALFAATIVAARRGICWIASPEQELILSDQRIGSLPIDVRNAIYQFQHKHMKLTGDSRPQSSAFRTTFENLGAYISTRDDFDNVEYTLGISVNMDSPIVRYLTKRWQLEGL